MKVEQIETEKLIPYARNAKKHDAAQVSSIAASVKEFGFNSPVLIDSENGIIAGHGRVLAAQKLGLKEVPCIRWQDVSKSMRRNGVVDLICLDCGTEFTTRKDTGALICRRCVSARSGRLKRNKPPIAKKRIPRKPCPVCGKGIRITDGFNYCSVACRMKASREERTCKKCGKQFFVLRSSINGKTNSSGNFCSRKCYEKWLCNSERKTGRGSQWRKSRNESVSIIPYCAICGKKHGLDVHHIVPFRLTFDNSQSNLIPLCKKHHKVVETITHDVEMVEDNFERMGIILKSMLMEKLMVTKYMMRRCAPI